MRVYATRGHSHLCRERSWSWTLTNTFSSRKTVHASMQVRELTQKACTGAFDLPIPHLEFPLSLLYTAISFLSPTSHRSTGRLLYATVSFVDLAPGPH